RPPPRKNAANRPPPAPPAPWPTPRPSSKPSAPNARTARPPPRPMRARDARPSAADSASPPHRPGLGWPSKEGVMTFLPITATFAALAALGLFALSLSVSLGRKRHRISLGEGVDGLLSRRVRAQANFAEFVPLALICLGLIEAAGLSPALVWGLGGVLTLARALHVWGLTTGFMPARF